jgi:hypothetical protein
MRIQCGYGRKTVGTNIKEYTDDGYDRLRAIELSQKVGAKFYRKKFPDKELPDYLREVSAWE